MDRQPEVIDLTADDETDTASCSEQKSTRYDLRKHENTVAKQTSICADQVIESTNKARDDTREVNNLKYDDPSESSDSSDQSNEDEDLNTKPKAEENGLSAYEQLRLERIKRNIAKLVSKNSVLCNNKLVTASADYFYQSTMKGITRFQC